MGLDNIQFKWMIEKDTASNYSVSWRLSLFNDKLSNMNY